MASAREKIPQLGLWDEEVSRVTHDEIVMWAYKNAETLVSKYIEFIRPIDDLSHVFERNWSKRSLRIPEGMTLEALPPLPEKPTEVVHKRSLETVIREYAENGRSIPRILGYADMVISWSPWYLKWDGEDNTWHPHSSHHSYRTLVEVKTSLPTIGELMRQLNLYRLVYRDVIVVAPDDSYAEILKEQGVLFVQYIADKP